jgi:hypothetical protein
VLQLFSNNLINKIIRKILHIIVMFQLKIVSNGGHSLHPGSNMKMKTTIKLLNEMVHLFKEMYKSYGYCHVDLLESILFLVFFLYTFIEKVYKYSLTHYYILLIS